MLYTRICLKLLYYILLNLFFKTKVFIEQTQIKKLTRQLTKKLTKLTLLKICLPLIIAIFKFFFLCKNMHNGYLKN